MVIWVIGMSGAGKSTVGQHVYQEIKQVHQNTVLIDGDQIRNIFQHENSASDYSLKERKRNSDRIVELCKWLDQQNIHVVCCILSLFEKEREKNRHRFSNYYEIYVSAPINFLIEQRDYRGLYRQSKKGIINNVVGIDIDFPEPKNPDFTIENTVGENDLRVKTNHIISQCLEKIEQLS